MAPISSSSTSKGAAGNKNRVIFGPALPSRAALETPEQAQARTVLAARQTLLRRVELSLGSDVAGELLRGINVLAAAGRAAHALVAPDLTVAPGLVEHAARVLDEAWVPVRGADDASIEEETRGWERARAALELVAAAQASARLGPGSALARERLQAAREALKGAVAGSSGGGIAGEEGGEEGDEGHRAEVMASVVRLGALHCKAFSTPGDA